MIENSGHPKVVVALALAPALLELLEDCDLTFVDADGSEEDPLRRALADADADGVLVNSNVSVDGETMASAPHLRVISTMSVGLDHIDLEAAAARGIVITNTPVLSDAVADLTMALITMLSRRLPQAMRAVATGGWKVPLGGDLAGKELLLVGFGRIGRAVATRALAAGMRVTYVDPVDGVPAVAGTERVDGLAAALPAADFVSLHVDLHAGTRWLMGHREFSIDEAHGLLREHVARWRGRPVGAHVGGDRRGYRRCRSRRAPRRTAAPRRPSVAGPERHHRAPHRLGHHRDPSGHGPMCGRQSPHGPAGRRRPVRGGPALNAGT